MQKPSEFFEDWFGSTDPQVPLEFPEVVRSIALAAALGFFVAGIYKFSSRRRTGATGLAETLVLLSMLISVVTLAIGNNAAAAFTLVGTLAIVRFRTPVRDIRDTAFVIYAVAVGLSVGARNPEVALVGGLLVGVVSVALSLFAKDADGSPDIHGRLSIRFDGIGPYDDLVTPVLGTHAESWRLLVARDAGQGKGTRMIYEINVGDAEGTAMVAALRQLDGVTRASLTLGGQDEDAG
ncbi:MAG: hypothetical protein CMJ83_03675 [Planctomycetes bacterium]|nr:hypothetical protein [Planctomycetota bacterium]